MSTPPTSLAALLRKHDLHLKKGLGQNFLADPVHLDRIVAAAELSRDDTVLEVGPGVGTLTARLAAQAGHVVAVELDAGLLPALQETLSGLDNVTIVQGDILQLDPAALAMTTTRPPLEPDGMPPGAVAAFRPAAPSTTEQARHRSEASDSSTVDRPPSTAHRSPLTAHRSPFTAHRYKVVANLPYYITSAAIRHLLTATPPPSLLVLTVQREVAQRIVAEPPQMSLLAVSVQFYARPEIVARIPAGAFVPPPKVDSAILRLRPWEHPPVSVPDEETFFAVARAGFGQRRKQLRNALRAGLGWTPQRVEALLAAAAIAPDRRAETLSLAEWGRLARLIGLHNGLLAAPAAEA